MYTTLLTLNLPRAVKWPFLKFRLEFLVYNVTVSPCNLLTFPIIYIQPIFQYSQLSLLFTFRKKFIACLVYRKRSFDHLNNSYYLRLYSSKWNLSIAKLNAFIELLYARGAYEAKNMDLSYLWNKKWGPSFFSATMSRNDYRNHEICSVWQQKLAKATLTIR